DPASRLPGGRRYSRGPRTCPPPRRRGNPHAATLAITALSPALGGANARHSHLWRGAETRNATDTPRFHIRHCPPFTWSATDITKPRGETMKVAVVAGNPKPNPRTLQAAEVVVEALTGSGRETVVDVVALGAGLLGWGDDAVGAAVEA